nr:hypothetical protein [Xanthomonas euroxanthea]
MDHPGRHCQQHLARRFRGLCRQRRHGGRGGHAGHRRPAVRHRWLSVDRRRRGWAGGDRPADRDPGGSRCNRHHRCGDLRQRWRGKTRHRHAGARCGQQLHRRHRT